MSLHGEGTLPLPLCNLTPTARFSQPGRPSLRAEAQTVKPHRGHLVLEAPQGSSYNCWVTTELTTSSWGAQPAAAPGGGRKGGARQPTCLSASQTWIRGVPSSRLCLPASTWAGPGVQTFIPHVSVPGFKGHQPFRGKQPPLVFLGGQRGCWDI